MASTTDPSIDQDLKTLKRMRKSVVIDRVKWVDRDTRRSRASHPRVLQKGARFTLHDLAPKDLARVSTAAPDAEIALVEFSYDLKPKNFCSDDEQARLLRETYLVLQRRLVPASGPFMTARTFRTNRPQPHRGELLIRRESKPKLSLSGQPLFRDPPQRSLAISSLSSAGLKKCHTIYWGDKPRETWSHSKKRQKGGAQVRLYIKTADHGAPLPREDWHVRVEITLNGPALIASVGARNVGDLASVNLRKLATTYLSMSRPLAVPVRVRVKSNPIFTEMFNRRFRSVADQDAKLATINGNFTQFEGGMVSFRKVPSLTELVADALYEYSRSVRKHRKLR